MIFEILGFAALTHLIVDFIDTLDTDDILEHKPFKCDMCMGYWISLLPFLYLDGLWGFLWAALTGVVADLIYRIKLRL